jgi:outer membrane protein OmpA-like peptidoglycan-associated protein
LKLNGPLVLLGGSARMRRPVVDEPGVLYTHLVAMRSNLNAPAWAFVVSMALVGCMPRPRPPELIALEKLRTDPTLSDPDREAFDLLAAADDLVVRSQSRWLGHDPVGARRDALMGQIKMKTALAILQGHRFQARIAELDGEIGLARDEAARLDEQLAAAQEEVALLERLRTEKAAMAAERKALSAQIDSAKKQAASERQRLTDQLAAQTLRADAIDGLRRAELAMRTADTVESARYAKAKYAAATSMLQQAHKEFDAGHWEEAIGRATLTAQEAQAATLLAQPQYEKAAAIMSDEARDRALEADVTALPGVGARLERAEDLQRLVLILDDLFDAGKSVLVPKGAKILDKVHDLLAKYPTYAVLLTGYSDDQGKAADLLASSLARANAVYWSLVARGIDARRMTVDAKGADDPIEDNTRPVPRARNNRVELTILYHIAQ